MNSTREQALAYVYSEEPDYAEAAAQLGAEALPHLRQIVEEGDLEFASKATCLASIIGGEQSVEIVEMAARSPNPVMRIAAAVSLSNLSEVPISLVERMLNDQDVGVRKVTIESLEIQKPAGVKSKVHEVALADPNPELRELASRVANTLS